MRNGARGWMPLLLGAGFCWATALLCSALATERVASDHGALPNPSNHWAFVPPTQPTLPQVTDARWARSPIDRFVLRRLEQEGLNPAPRAAREVLLRRVSLDLTGLPPTPGEVDAFLADGSPEAFERVVERLLASPHYGERWGRHWLDVARYADSGGFETDIFFAHAWRYRDYVFRAFNADKPFDRFIREQIAGDELFPGDPEAVLATGLYTTGPVLEEAGMVPGKLEYNQLTDAVDTTGSAFLGLTVACARCHDHKYDPLSQREYYGLQALFAASDQFDYSESGARLRGRAALKQTLSEFESEQLRGRARREPDAAQREVLLAKLRKARLELDAASPIPIRVLAHLEKPIEVKLLRRGELEMPGEVVGPSFPSRLGWSAATPEPSADRRRAALANWIVSENNPLTARVFVNRVWQWHFGQGLVRTPNDFGVRGERPTHPELLDWLAVDFVQHGWSVKHLHRRILNSSTYQMSAEAEARALERDPDNRLLTRSQPRRAEAEVAWDSLRMLAGSLNTEMGGLPFAPPLDAQEMIGNFLKWPVSTPAEADRRAVYILTKRSFRFPTLSAFDLPDNVNSCGRRDITTVPNQALTMLNNRTVRQQADAFAQRLIRETGGGAEAVLELAWKYAYGRGIRATERERALEFLRDRSPPSEGRVTSIASALAELCLALFNTNEFIYIP